MKNILTIILIFTVHVVTAQSFRVQEDTTILQLRDFLQRDIRYPAIARENDVQGTALVAFEVGKGGNIIGANIKNGLIADCNDAIISSLKRYSHILPLKRGEYMFSVCFHISNASPGKSFSCPQQGPNKNFLFQVQKEAVMTVRSKEIVY